MNTILQKRIEAESNKYMEEAIEMNSVVGDNLHYKDLKTCFIEAADFALQNQWISVEEALPEIKEHFMSEDVLCKYSDGSMGFDYLKENIFGQQWFEHECEESVVTHWMLIPQLKGGENE